MSMEEVLQVASVNRKEVGRDWMAATQVRPIIFEDRALIWLEYHGEKYGLLPEESPLDFLKFIGRKGCQFQEKYEKEVMPDAVRVCNKAYEVRSVDKLEETLRLIETGVPVISQAALWWGPERIYGVPDFVVHTSWLRKKFPTLISERDAEVAAPNLNGSGRPGHYVVFDTKFTTKLEEGEKAKDFENYKAQLRIYSFIVGKLQGLMPRAAFLAARDRLLDPITVSLGSQVGGPLDKDLAEMRDLLLEIKLNGERYVPWKDEIVASNLSHPDERWDTAKNAIATEKFPGRDPELVYQISGSVKRELAGLGYVSLDSMLQGDPGSVLIEKCKGIGAKRAKQIRAILGANRSGKPVVTVASLAPKKKEFEFYVDFEYFTNVNVDFDVQWPRLEGCEMIFMVGVGREDAGNWSFDALVSAAETPNAELEMFERFLDFLRIRTNGALLDKSRTSLYHWTGAEVWQAKRAADRQGLSQDHALRSLPWSDLQKTFLEGPVTVPGAWNFALKDVTRALSNLDARYATEWPGELDKGLRAMVMGWKGYKNAEPFMSGEMNTLKTYLEADCKALWNILKWLRGVC